MKLFGPLYDRVLAWSRHPKAPWFLGFLSFAESSFFPIPPDVMLAPMALAQPKSWFRLALLTTLTSVLGGLLGYLIGWAAMDAVMPWVERMGYAPKLAHAQLWFEQWGFWAVLLAGFSPIPYKVFTIAAGGLSMALLPFTIASFVGRGLRFFMVAGLMAWGGPRMESFLHRYVDRIGWAVVALVVAGGIWYRLSGAA